MVPARMPSKVLWSDLDPELDELRPVRLVITGGQRAQVELAGDATVGFLKRTSAMETKHPVELQVLLCSNGSAMCDGEVFRHGEAQPVRVVLLYGLVRYPKQTPKPSKSLAKRSWAERQLRIPWTRGNAGNPPKKKLE